MVFFRLPTCRLGISPSVRSMYDMNKLTPSQKLQLVSNRIFGTAIGGNLRNGNQELKSRFNADRRVEQYNVPVHNPLQLFPFLRDYDDIAWQEKLEDGRKMRIMMRGVKIGRSKGGGRMSILNIYERKKAAIEGTEAE